MNTEQLVRKGRKLERRAKKDLARAKKDLAKATTKLERKAKKDLAKATGKAKKQWKQFSKQEQTVMIAGAIIQLTLMAAAQIDISRRSADEIRGKKWIWRLLVLINFVGPLAYFAVGRKGKAKPVAEVTEIGDAAVA